MEFIAEFEFEINELPCIIGVTYYEPYTPAYISGPPEDCYPAEGGYSEWKIMKLSGQPYTWLEKNLTPEQIERVNERVMAYFEERRHSDYDYDYDYA